MIKIEDVKKLIEDGYRLSYSQFEYYKYLLNNLEIKWD
jgi:hypothetical protein